MSLFGNVPTDSLVDAVEKSVAALHDQDLADALEAQLPNMSPAALGAFVEAILDAFRDRGESSEDVAEAAGVLRDEITQRQLPAVAGLVRYGNENSGLLKEAVAAYAEEHPALVDDLPKALVDGISQRVTPGP